MLPTSTSRAILCLALALPMPPALDGHGLQDGPTGFEAKLADAETLMNRRQFEDALRIYKDANALRDKKSAAALLGMARAYMGMHDPRKALGAATDALKHVGSDPAVHADALNARGLAHFALGSQKVEDKRWKQAEEDFRAALAIDDARALTRYNLGVTLLKQGRDEEGVRELGLFLERLPRGADSDNARRFIENPRRARDNFAPDFAMTTLDGSLLSSDALKGKVVLIDFWATWCAPCVAATPGLARIRKRLDTDSFVIIGISADRSSDAWKQFIEDNELSWPHYLDSRRTMAELFGVRAYPTYLLIDHEGIIRYRHQGWNPSVDGEIQYQASRLLKALPRAGSR